MILFVAFVSSWPHAQEGHPLTGTWSGDVGARHVTLALEWDGKNITGTINPGPDAARITSVRLDPAMWAIHLEADGKDHIVIDGGLSNLGSPSRTLTGTWTEGGAKTPITLTRVDSQSASSNSGALPAAQAYDSSRRVTLRGTVTNVDWINPRVRFALLVRDARTSANWTIELADPATTLERNGWNARSLKVGDAVIVQAAAATGSAHEALANSVVLTKGGAQLFKLSVTTQSPYAPVPRWPDGQPRLGAPPGTTGYWKTDAPDLDVANLKAGDAAAMPWAKAVYDYRVRTGLKDDPIARCVPPGGPRQFLGPQGFQLVEQRELGRILVLLGDGDRNWRIISTDGRPLGQAADVVPSYYGSSVGHWDKDTLAVESVGYNEKFWFLSGGLPHTEALHLTERFTRTDLNTMKYDVTIDDPRTYTKSWTASWTMRWVANQEIQEFFCEEKTS
ncbi:MAG TPA: DUF6152 family protein [Vicinamibacterales bacterium]|nr:DUF6152 family protein [Vicinamibacterales bacterium]